MSEDGFPRRLGLCQYAGLCLSGTATVIIAALTDLFSVGTGDHPTSFSRIPTPPRAKGAQHPPSMLQKFSAHSRAWMEDREGKIAALGEGWPGDCWRQHRAGWEPPTLTHAAGAALSSLRVIKLPALQPLPNVSVHPKLRAWGVLLQQTKNKPSPIHPMSLSFQRS